MNRPRWAGSGKNAPKIRATPTIVNGTRFPSKLEAERFIFLRDRLSEGVIRDLILQPQYPLVIDGRPILTRSSRYPNGRKSKWRGDFGYTICASDETVIEDTKGYDTYRMRLRRAIVEAIYDIEIKVITDPRSPIVSAQT